MITVLEYASDDGDDEDDGDGDDVIQTITSPNENYYPHYSC